MTTTLGLFHVSENTNSISLSSINQRLLTKCNALPLGPWTLDHRLLRATANDNKTPPRFQHLLYLSYHPKNVYVAVSPLESTTDGAKDTVVAIPASQYESLFNLLTAKFTALWNLRSRHHVINGSAYTVGEFTVRVGELRELGGPQEDRGIVCCIETSSATEESDTIGKGDLITADQMKKVENTAKAELASLWARIGIESARETFTSHSITATSEDAFNEARLWCSLLRLRA